MTIKAPVVFYNWHTSLSSRLLIRSQWVDQSALLTRNGQPPDAIWALSQTGGSAFLVFRWPMSPSLAASTDSNLPQIAPLPLLPLLIRPKKAPPIVPANSSMSLRSAV